MSQNDRLSTEARMTADETTPSENDFFEVRKKRKRLHKQIQNTIDKVRPILVSINSRPSLIQFTRAIRSNFHVVKI